MYAAKNASKGCWSLSPDNESAKAQLRQKLADELSHCAD